MQSARSELQGLQADGLAAAEPYRRALQEAQTAADRALLEARKLEERLREALELVQQGKQVGASVAQAATQPALESQLAHGLAQTTNPLQSSDMRLTDAEKRGRFWFEIGIQPEDLLLRIARLASKRGDAQNLNYWPNNSAPSWFEVGYDVWSLDLAHSFGSAEPEDHAAQAGTRARARATDSSPARARRDCLAIRPPGKRPRASAAALAPAPSPPDGRGTNHR